MKHILLLIFSLSFLLLSSAAIAATKTPLCGNVRTIPDTPLDKSPYPFIFDSRSDTVQLLPSPDGHYTAVLRHGACDTTSMGIWDKRKRRAYGNKTVTLSYGVSGTCWDPKQPVVYFFENNMGYKNENAGIYRWDFLKNPDKPTRIDTFQAVGNTFQRDFIDADLIGIDKSSQHLLLKISYAHDEEKETRRPNKDIDMYYIYSIRGRNYKRCDKCKKTETVSAFGTVWDH